MTKVTREKWVNGNETTVDKRNNGRQGKEHPSRLRRTTQLDAPGHLRHRWKERPAASEQRP